MHAYRFPYPQALKDLAPSLQLGFERCDNSAHVQNEIAEFLFASAGPASLAVEEFVKLNSPAVGVVDRSVQ